MVGIMSRPCGEKEVGAVLCNIYSFGDDTVDNISCRLGSAEEFSVLGDEHCKRICVLLAKRGR